MKMREGNIEQIKTRSDQEIQEEANDLLMELIEELKYEEVQSFEGLELSDDEQNKRLFNELNLEQRTEEWRLKNGEPNTPEVKFFIKEREDGEKVKVIASITGVKEASSQFPKSLRIYFAADIFSPAMYEGHGGNHDYTPSELRGSLERASDRK